MSELVRTLIREEPIVVKLPKDVMADPRQELLWTLLSANVRPLCENGRNQVATFPLNAALTVILRQALAYNQAIRGGELIVPALAREQKGLDALNQKTGGASQLARISRVLFMAADGSTRFYRDCDSLISRYPQRLLGCRLDVTAFSFGEALFGSPNLVRALLIIDKKASSRALLALVQEKQQE
jgi:hypothetical protein